MHRDRACWGGCIRSSKAAGARDTHILLTARLVLAGALQAWAHHSAGAQIPLPPLDEKRKVTEDVEKDRRYAIDAAIVRTMKSRKQLTHQALIMEARPGPLRLH